MTGAASVSPFRLFGRPARDDHGAPNAPDPWLDDPHPAASPRRSAPPGPRTDAPATAAARPALWTPRRPPADPPPEPEPVTDPFGFPPVPPAGSTTAPPAPAPATDDVAAAWAAWAPAGPVLSPEPAAPVLTPEPAAPVPAPEPSATAAGPSGFATAAEPSGPVRAGTAAGWRETAPVRDDTASGQDDTASAQADTASGREPATGPAPEPAAPDGPGGEHGIDPADASALAGAFAADLLSWDEDDPARRGHALAGHLADPAPAALLGWSGTGRQRADLVLPGRVRPGTGGRVHVDVRVRVVPYRRVDARGTGSPEPEPDQPLGEPAAAPAVSARGWRGLAARWVRLEVTVARDGDRLVVDAGPRPGAEAAAHSPRDLAALRRSS